VYRSMGISFNNHVFKGHRALLGSKYVTYAEVELSIRYDTFSEAQSFEWGNTSKGAKQLAYSILYQLEGHEIAKQYALKFMNDVIRELNSRDWILPASKVLEWLEQNCEKEELKIEKEREVISVTTVKKSKKRKSNVVKDICKELNITQKNLAEILEVPEGTVSSWAVKNEIPRLGKKAIEFYMLNIKNQKIVDSYRSFKELLEA